MRPALPALATLATLVFASASPAHADPYKWCADYTGRSGGGTNCYFKTFEQCRASVSGIGGFCRINGFYDGKPVRTPEDGYAYRPNKHRS